MRFLPLSHPILFPYEDEGFGKALVTSLLVWVQALVVSSAAGSTIPGDGEKHF